MDFDQEEPLFQKVLFDCLSNHPFLSLFAFNKGAEFMTPIPMRPEPVSPIPFSHNYTGADLNALLYEAASRLAYEVSYHALHMLVEGILIYQIPTSNEIVNIHFQPIEVIETDDLESTLKDFRGGLCFYSRDLFNNLPYPAPGQYLLGFLEPKDTLIFSPSNGEFDGIIHFPYPKPWLNIFRPKPFGTDFEAHPYFTDHTEPTKLLISGYYLPVATQTSAFKLVRLSENPQSRLIKKVEPSPDHDPQIWNSIIW